MDRGIEAHLNITYLVALVFLVCSLVYLSNRRIVAQLNTLTAGAHQNMESTRKCGPH